jgi:hypothetical protein
MTSTLKSILLGSAASLIATAAAQAADLPVKKAAAVQYVKVCTAYGSGFYELPGTDICIRHFGSMKFNFGIQDERTSFNGEDFDVEAGASNTTGWQWTIRPGWDFRSPTEFGTLRTVVQMRVDHRNGVFENDNPALTGAQRVNNMIHRGYIEWAGFILGKAGSQFPYWDQDDVISAIGGDPKTSTMQLTYVFAFPGGLKATIGLEDSTAWASGGGDFVDAQTTSNFNVGLGPQRRYDIVGTLSTEQPWGSAKVAGAIHFTQTNADVMTTPPTGRPGRDTTEINTGWGLLAGITFKMPWLGENDQLLLQASACDGAIAYCGISSGASASSTSFERAGQFLHGLQRGDVDTYVVSAGPGGTWDFENVSGVALAGQLRHYWAPLWRSNLMASYTWIDVPDVASTILWANGGRVDAQVFDIAANLIWGRSRRTLEIGVEVMYKTLKNDPMPATLFPAPPDPRFPFVDRNPDGWAVVGFVQRAW